MALTHGLSTPAPPDRIVVIGAGGFVGGAIFRRLLADGLEVLAVGRREIDLETHGADARLSSLLRPGDCVVFAAARAPCRDLGMMIENMSLVRTVLAALAEVVPSHLLNISSDAVYGDETVPISEKHATAPTTMHGAMHLAREIALGAVFGDRLAVLRPTLIYGASDPHNGYGPNRFRRLAARSEEIVLFGEGEERRDHVCIDDVAELAARVVLRRSIGVLNVATGEVHSFRNAAEMAAAAAGASAVIRGTPRVGPMPHNGYRAFDPEATRAAFPDFTYMGLADGLERVSAGTAGVRRHG